MVALVTGGYRGIGLGIATALAKDGHSIVITGRHAGGEVDAALETLRHGGQAAEFVQADVSLAADRERLVAAVEKRFGRLDVLVNNAGIAPRVRADILEATEESFDELISVNLKGPYFLTQRVAQWMVRQRRADAAYRGCIVNVSSCSATVVSVNRGDYCLSKAGVSMATQLWTVRLAEFGIDVYEVRPGIIRTDMTKTVTEKYDALIAGGLLVEKRWGTPADIGRAVAMLARGDLPYASGTVLNLDGGLTIQRL
jgi:NAD(P)-dependent dehydrogenase (short-subunit alcohol dehydrogenase family)